MGDIGTHKEVVLHMIPQLQQISAAENYTYVEFGNFLTDVSQFRDPVAFLNAKPLLKLGRLIPFRDPLVCGELNGFLGWGKFNEWMDRVFGVVTKAGTQPVTQPGTLPEYFQHLSLAFAHIKFSETSGFHYGNLTPLSAAEVDRVFAAAFTQYYPHEHVDYPPLNNNISGPDASYYQIGERKLLKYLDKHIAFISEELSKIEFEWVQNRNLPATHPTRCDLLVRLGHILHAVEDFFFHSNVVELRQWNRVVKKHSDRHPEKDADDYRFIISKILTDTGHDESSIRFRRRLARRLRYPNYDVDRFEPRFPSKPSSMTSRLSVDFAYTGGFGSEDVSHTLSGGLELLEAKSMGMGLNTLLDLLKMLDPRFQVPLLEALISAEERRAINDCDKLRDRINRQESQVMSGDYAPVFDVMQSRNWITKEAKKAFIEAFDLDRNIMTAYPGKRGLGGFLLVWLRLIQKKVDASHEMVSSLDQDTESPYDFMVENGATEETVGSHSLMAKDGAEKDPLRGQAMALAKCASAALAVTLLQRIRDDPNPDRGLNWNSILPHFMRVPPGTANSWEEQVIAALNAGDDIPTLSSLQDKPTVAMITGYRVQALRTGQRRSQGEGFYRGFEKEP